ncbi:unnamed protein product [Amaranthus hypochondriacus]
MGDASKVGQLGHCFEVATGTGLGCSPECRSSIPLVSVHGHGSSLNKDVHVNNSNGPPNIGVLNSPGLLPFSRPPSHVTVDDNGFRAYKRLSHKKRVSVQPVPSQSYPPTNPIGPGVTHDSSEGDMPAPLLAASLTEPDLRQNKVVGRPLGDLQTNNSFAVLHYIDRDTHEVSQGITTLGADPIRGND